jgi:hypothetical protein
VIQNAGYEDSAAVDQPGAAAYWTAASVSTLEETAAFAGDDSLAFSGYETFEHGWGSLNPQALQIELVEVVDIESLLPERFELGWEIDQGFFFLTTLASFPFDTATQAFEDFEDGWGTIDRDMTLSPSESVAAVFDSEDFEDFEEQWGATPFTMGSVTAAVFDIGGFSASSATPSNAEKFGLKARQRVQSIVGDNTMAAVTPPLSVVVGDAVTFIAEEGSLPVPLDESTTYIVQTVASDTCTLAPHPGATVVDITADGFGANYLLPDPGRFWSEEL